VLMSSSKSYLRDADENSGEQSVDSELSDVGLCTLNKYEYMYNSLLCLAFSGDYEHALTLATNIIDNAHPDYALKVHLLRGVLAKALGRSIECTSSVLELVATADFTAARKSDPTAAKAYLEKAEPCKVEIFPEQSRLCAGFPHVKLAIASQTPLVNLFLIKQIVGETVVQHAVREAAGDNSVRRQVGAERIHVQGNKLQARGAVDQALRVRGEVHR
jgi:hypothetical protein